MKNSNLLAHTRIPSPNVIISISQLNCINLASEEFDGESQRWRRIIAFRCCFIGMNYELVWVIENFDFFFLESEKFTHQSEKYQGESVSLNFGNNITLLQTQFSSTTTFETVEDIKQKKISISFRFHLISSCRQFRPLNCAEKFYGNKVSTRHIQMLIEERKLAIDLK